MVGLAFLEQTLAHTIYSTRCPVANHWGCISGTKQSELIRTIHQAETATWRSRHGEEASSRRSPAPSKREDLEDRETTGFLCAWCSKAAPESCFSCHETVPSPLPVTEDHVEPLFRCNICTRASHYAHLHQPPGEEDPKDAGELATYYQSMLRWKCWDCASFNYPLDKIIAWRPFPANAKETGSGPLHVPDYSASLPREYLVKWQDKSYRRVGWVPHMWLFATNRQKLRKFVQEGRTLKLLDQATQEAEAKEAEEHGMMMDVDDEEMLIEDGMPSLTKQAALLAPLVDAEQRIPPAWRTVDRVLDVMIWHPPTPKSANKSKGGKKSKRVESDEELTPEAQAQLDDAINYGDQPEMSFMETIEDYEKRTKRNISVNEAGDVIWALFKWGDLGYDEGAGDMIGIMYMLIYFTATWDSPPQEGDPGYEAYERAYGRFIKARSIPKATGPSGLAKGKRPRSHWMRNPLKNNDILDLGQDPKYKLMDFQVCCILVLTSPSA
jgi:chromodomain-helicase-DNA-binding protein 4